MSTPITKNLAFAELTTLAGERIVTPLSFPHMAWLDSTPKAMARRAERLIQSHLVDTGHYLDALRITDPAEFTMREVEVELPEGGNSRNAVLQPARRLQYTAFVAALEDGRHYAFVPALGVVTTAAAAELDDAIADSIRLEHARAERLADARRMVAAHWYDEASVTTEPVALIFHTADELAQLNERRPDPLLQEVASHLAPPPRSLVGLPQQLADLKRAAEGQFARSVLIIGPEGSGKTALVQEYARSRKRRQLTVLQETTASRMVQALTRDAGWQHSLAVLCNELRDGEVLLYVGHLHELFEVGQYEGNAVSIGEALREPLQRGQVMLIAECTETEYAAINLRSPGFTALFQELHLHAASDAEHENLALQAVTAACRECKVGLEPAVITELVALQRRFSPYSGFPGKPIRFFDALLAQPRERPQITRDDVLEAFCLETGIPRFMVDARLPLDPATMEAFFRRRIFGQDAAVDVVCNVLAAAKTGLARRGKPIANLLFIGPTGVGKTETAKALAEFMFGDPRRMLRFDMSEYSDPEGVLRLIGDLGAGGAGAEGSLVSRVRRDPFAVVLFDELEKAHPSFFDVLLQVLGEGRLTAGDGSVANFCGTIVVMTSNIGADGLQRTPLGLTATAGDPARHFEQAVQDYFRPELFNRIDHVVPFAVLDAERRAPIFRREMELLLQRDGLCERLIDFLPAPEVAAWLAARPGDARYGARDVQRVIRRDLVLPLAYTLAQRPYTEPLVLAVTADEASLDFSCKPGRASNELGRLNSADAASDARRALQRLCDGPVVVELTNLRFRLETEQRRHEVRQRRTKAQAKLKGRALRDLQHWEDTEAGIRLRAVVAWHEQLDRLREEIFAIEAAALLKLASLDNSADEVAPPDAALPALPEWKLRLARLKQEAMHLARPAGGACFVTIYGAEAQTQLLFTELASLAALLKAELRAQVVRLVGDACKKFDWPEPPNAKPPANALIVGYEVVLQAPSIRDYLAGESGAWRFIEGDRKSDCYFGIHPHPIQKYETPPDAHRRAFVEDKPVVRHLKEGRLSDPNQPSWFCDFPAVQDWKRALDARWQQTIDRLMLGGMQ